MKPRNGLLLRLKQKCKISWTEKSLQQVERESVSCIIFSGSSLAPEEYDEASERIGMAAVKYFDLK